MKRYVISIIGGVAFVLYNAIGLGWDLSNKKFASDIIDKVEKDGSFSVKITKEDLGL